MAAFRNNQILSRSANGIPVASAFATDGGAFR